MSDHNVGSLTPETVHGYIFEMIGQLASLADRVDDEELAGKLRRLLGQYKPLD